MSNYKPNDMTLYQPISDDEDTSQGRTVRSPPYGLGGPDSPTYSPETPPTSPHPSDNYPTPKADKNGKRPANFKETGPSKRTRIPFYNQEDMLLHMARIDDRIEMLEKKKDQEIQKLMEENAQLKKELSIVKAEGERNTRWGKQSLAWLREDVDARMKIEKHRVDQQFAIKGYDNNVVNSRVTNLYDNLEYLYEKQKEKNQKVEKFMKEVEEERKKK